MSEQTSLGKGKAPAAHTTPIRRIVTGHDENMNAIFLEDQFCPNRFLGGGIDTLVVNELWKMESLPGDNTAAYEDPATVPALNPPAGGNVFRIIEFPPDSELGGKPELHRTPSVDYAVVLKGECYAILEEGTETLMKELDVLVQRGTIHGWSNRSDKPCLMLFVLNGADPIPGLAHK